MTLSGGMLSEQAQGPGASDSTLRTVEVPGFSLPFTVPSTAPSTVPVPVAYMFVPSVGWGGPASSGR